MRVLHSIISETFLGHSYNTPILCSSAVWNPIATTLGNILSVGVRPIGLFVDRNNTVYVAARTLHSIQTWAKGTGSPSTALFGSLLQPYSVYATITGDIYADSRFSRDRIEKLVENATVSTIAMYVDGICHGIFVDIYDGIYCSLGDFHKVIKRASKDDVNISTIVAGTGVSGSTSDMLDTPQGIFVTIGFSLYVADSANNRIQFFRAMQLNGSTVAGNGAPDTITLDSPTGVVLDSQHNLFIADSNNNRIVGSSPNGFRCIAGCSAGSGSAANQLDRPQSLSFDSFGNLFVADTYNNRVQKFTLSINACGKISQGSVLFSQNTFQVVRIICLNSVPMLPGIPSPLRLLIIPRLVHTLVIFSSVLTARSLLWRLISIKHRYGHPVILLQAKLSLLI